MRRGARYESRYEKYSNKTFGEAVGVWFEDPHYTGKSKRRQAISYEALIDYLEDVRLEDVDDQWLMEFKEDRLEGSGRFTKKVRAGTLQKDLSFVRTILNYSCRVLRWIPSVPLIRMPNGPRMRAQVYSWEQQDALFSNLPDYMLGPAIFAVNTGARMGEIIGKEGLRWEQEQSQPQMGSFLFVVDGKNGHERAIILNSIARKIVNDQRGNGSEYVFAKDGKLIKYWCRDFLEAYYQTDMSRSPDLKKGAHNLRHTFGTRCAALGAPKWIISRLLGHANSDITEHYAQGVLEGMDEWTEKLTKRFDYTPLRSVRMVG